MRNVLLLTVLLLVVGAAVHADEPPVFDFKVYVSDRAGGDDVEVYGTFSAEEGRFGGLEIVFFRDSDTYAIRALETMGDMVAMHGGSARRDDSNDIDVILRLFLSPTPTRDGEAYLTGTKVIMENASDTDTPLFRITEEPYAGFVANGGDTRLTFTGVPSGRALDIDLAVSYRDPRRTTSARDDGRFMATFSLVNEDAGRFEIENESCEMEFGTEGPEGRSKCTHERMFRLANGDSLLYVATYRLEEADRRDDGSIRLTLAVERWFFVDPMRFFTGPTREVVAGKTYGSGHSEIKSTVSINGKKRSIEAVIEDGTISSFKWDNIVLTKADIVRNWNDVVTIMTQVQDNQHLYRMPYVDDEGDRTQPGFVLGLMNNPVNYTGSEVKSTTYQKSFTIEPRQDVEIDIPLGRHSLLPFQAREIVKIRWPASGSDARGARPRSTR